MCTAASSALAAPPSMPTSYRQGRTPRPARYPHWARQGDQPVRRRPLHRRGHLRPAAHTDRARAPHLQAAHPASRAHPHGSARSSARAANSPRRAHRQRRDRPRSLPAGSGPTARTHRAPHSDSRSWCPACHDESASVGDLPNRGARYTPVGSLGVTTLSTPLSRDGHPPPHRSRPPRAACTPSSWLSSAACC